MLIDRVNIVLECLNLSFPYTETIPIPLFYIIADFCKKLLLF